MPHQCLDRNGAGLWQRRGPAQRAHYFARGADPVLHGGGRPQHQLGQGQRPDRQTGGRWRDQQDLQTSGLTVQPVYTGPKQLITSYQVVDNVTVTLYDLAEAGKIIDDAASAAGNAIVVNSIAFSVKDDTPCSARPGRPPSARLRDRHR